MYLEQSSVYKVRSEDDKNEQRIYLCFYSHKSYIHIDIMAYETDAIITSVCSSYKEFMKLCDIFINPISLYTAYVIKFGYVIVDIDNHSTLCYRNMHNEKITHEKLEGTHYVLHERD